MGGLFAAAERGPYGRHVEKRDGALIPYQGPTYYGLPAMKAPHYGWLITTYFWAGGIAGSSMVLATVADVFGRGRKRRIVRAGRYLALAGATLSPVLLIADLHTPQRWYNMMRIFRKTSAMSIGSWTLAAFGTLAGLTALGQFWEDRTGSPWGRRLARLFDLPAAAAGTMMSVYTGTLLAATNTPLWATVPRLLPALFGASAASTAAAAISLTLAATGEADEEGRAVDHFALAAGATELALVESARRHWRAQELDGPLREEPLASAFRFGALGLGVVLPLALHGLQLLAGRRSRTVSTLAAVSTLAGGFLLRASLLFGGKQSAHRPEDYFKITQPRELPELAARPEPSGALAGGGRGA